MTHPRAPVPVEALAMLRRRLAMLPPRHPDRKEMMVSTCRLYAVSRATLYRLLRGERRPRDAHRSDRGHARVMGDAEIERWCEIVAAVKKSTTNRKGRHLSTARALKLVEEHGVHTPDGHRQLAPGTLTISTLNRHMRRLGYDHARMVREAAAVRFQAENANDLWHFDMSPSDLKQLAVPPPWVDLERGGAPTLMLFSVVDDRSGMAYVEYHCVYGEDVEAALGFLFRAMAPKSEGSTNPLQGIPRQLYLDNGPVLKSAVFRRVMESLDVIYTAHLPAGSDGTRTTARSKGKVERPFRTVKEAHETLYHHHQPETEEEANAWLTRFVDRENGRDHRSGERSRIEDWLEHQPEGGIRAMCAWERFCSFAREPERRTVGLDARVSVAGVTYELDPELAGETVVLWWGLFDAQLFAEYGNERYGPFDPVGGPVPLHRYRKHRKTRRDVRQDRVAELANRISIPRSALSGEPDLVAVKTAARNVAIVARPFKGPDPFQEVAFATPLRARAAIADELRLPLGKLGADDLRFITDLLARTLDRREIMQAIRERFPPGCAHAG